MDLATYQSAAERTMHLTVSDDDRLVNAALGLCGEATELIELADPQLDKTIKEAGDVAWYCAQAARALGTSVASSRRRPRQHGQVIPASYSA